MSRLSSLDRPLGDTFALRLHERRPAVSYSKDVRDPRVDCKPGVHVGSRLLALVFESLLSTVV